MAENLLRCFLRIAGCFCATAAIAFLMPRSWIIVCHEKIGLGAFPEQPIAEYLARFTSGMCAFYGGLLIYLSLDVRRFAPVIRFQALFIVLLAIPGYFLSVHSGMPTYWAVSDSIGACTMSLITLALLKASHTGTDNER